MTILGVPLTVILLIVAVAASMGWAVYVCLSGDIPTYSDLDYEDPEPTKGSRHA